MNVNEDKGIHDGHRRRMKDKLARHGARIFDTYELLEMLLYYAIPYRDTNPVAKRLLSAFGSLDGVFSATKEELLSVSGIGERAAELILTTGDMLYEGELSRANRAEHVFDNYCDTGLYLTRYFEENEGLGVTALMLDNCMRLLTRVDIFNVDFGTAAVKSKVFIDAALKSGATVTILAHTRPHSALYPAPYDLATVRMISADLGAVGVRVAEHYVIAGSDYLGVSERISIRLASDTPELARFLESRREVTSR